MEAATTSILSILGIYLLLGLLFSVFFLWKGIHKVDPLTKGTGFFFKLLLLPGMTALWIVFLRKWLKAK